MLIKITEADYRKLEELQVKKRSDWHAVFSTNYSENPWPFVTRGWTSEELRIEVQRQSPILDRIVGIYLEIRPIGGRMFINIDGVFRSTAKGHDQFVKWDFGKDTRRAHSPLTGEAARREYVRLRESLGQAKQAGNHASDCRTPCQP